jgi:hypothetical protein
VNDQELNSLLKELNAATDETIARTKRFIKYMEDRPPVRHLSMSEYHKRVLREEPEEKKLEA